MVFQRISVILVLTFLCKVYADDVLISSPHVTNYGDWGEIEKCPEGAYVFGYKLKVQHGGGVLVDDTALNGIELLCISLAKRHNATLSKALTPITSTVGHAGDFGIILECPEPAFAVGFQLRSEPNQLLYDDSAANDLKLSCSTGETLEGYGDPIFGDWTEPQHCPRSTYICGIQTQVESDGQTDNTSLNNVNMVCCDHP
ncbi:Vitelline membrane outer layer protein 1 [Orchesella cincta]|uniref:Vitelline membrane outer layer protein 1 n=1 Tax=Orchesella cincta TaxID=48709 RepID=A0A1D2MGC9_ORCCI|nr:Vitelline membrane outer layer protein 1 [Orchesella cincta]